MATGTILLPIAGAMLDATNPPGVGFANSIMKLLFDDTTPQLCYWQFRMPTDYASGPIAKLALAMASATSGSVDWEVSIMAVTAGDAQDIDTESYATINSASATVPGTAGHLTEISSTLTNDDSLSARDLVRVRVARDADDVSNDTATGDAELQAVSIEYTTT
jgi:hypothetical protein